MFIGRIGLRHTTKAYVAATSAQKTSAAVLINMELRVFVVLITFKLSDNLSTLDLCLQIFFFWEERMASIFYLCTQKYNHEHEQNVYNDKARCRREWTYG